jgi:pimeloyl-ACP methyl ester carboxylesterase
MKNKGRESSEFLRPQHSLYISEPLRASMELGSLALYSSWLDLAPQGDGHAVMVIPGFTADGRSTKILRDYICRLGYSVSCWRQGVNLGVRKDLFDGAMAVLNELFERHDGRVSIVGQSLGGIYAREMAKSRPEKVRQVISLGSPFNDPGGVRSNVSELYKLFNPEKSPKSAQSRSIQWNPQLAPSVPTTAIYSKSDGVCHWRSCIQHGGGHDRLENIEVAVSHIGMVVNAQVFYAVADRLAQDQERWRPFNSGE